MIGMVRENLLGAVKLFGQHAADQKMGPCHGPEGKHQVGLL